MQEEKTPIIRTGFTNINGSYFSYVREIAFNKGDYLRIGKPITMSHQENNSDSFMSDDHIYGSMFIYQDNINPNVGYRIYDSYNDYRFNGNRDDVLIQNLQERQENVQLTKFPTGVVTYGGFIIGQEMPFFPNSQNIDAYLKKCNLSDAFALYKQLLLMFKELCLNGIMYTDIHPGNIIIDSKLNLELIDFDMNFIDFDNKKRLEVVIRNLYNLINILTTKIYKTPKVLSDEKISHDFDFIMEELTQKENILIKK